MPINKNVAKPNIIPSKFITYQNSVQRYKYFGVYANILPLKFARLKKKRSLHHGSMSQRQLYQGILLIPRGAQGIRTAKQIVMSATNDHH